MSPDDEALMWDILDLTSSSFPDMSGFDDLLPRQEESATKEMHSSGDPAGKDAQGKSNAHAPEMGSFPGQEISIFAEGAPQPIEEDPASQWPFTHQVGRTPLVGVPDIPDWMIFGDFTEHL